MINVYIEDKKNNVLGFNFYLFGSDKFVTDYDKYKDFVDMNNYLETSKSDILGINIESFLIYCEKNMMNTTHLIEESIRKLKRLNEWRVRHRYEYYRFLEFVIKGKSMFKDLVNTVNKDKKTKAIMMYYIIIDFAEKEVCIVGS